MKYEMGYDDLPLKYQCGKRHNIQGKLKKTDRTVKPIRSSERRIWADEKGDLFVKIQGKWWKFPEEIEY